MKPEGGKDQPSEVGLSRGRSGIEILRSVSGVYSWKVVVASDDDSEEGLRAAMALAAQLEGELREQYGRRHQTGTSTAKAAHGDGQSNGRGRHLATPPFGSDDGKDTLGLKPRV